MAKAMVTKMFKLLRYMKQYRLRSLLAPIFKMIEALFELFVPLVVKKIIDEGIGNSDISLILCYCGLLALLALIGLTLAVAAQYFASAAAVSFASEVRRALYNKVLALPASKSDKLGTNRMIAMLTGDILQVQTGVNMVLRLFMRSPVVVFGAVIMAFLADDRGFGGTGPIFLIVVPLLAVAVVGVMIAGVKRYKEVRTGAEELTLDAREDLSGMRVFRSFGQEETRIARAKNKNERLTRALVRAGKISALTGPFTLVIVNFGIIALLYFGGVSIEEGALSTGTLIALYNYLSQILIELVKLANLNVTVSKSIACGNRIEKVLELSEETEHLIEEFTTENGGGLRFENVSLTYPDGTSALENISLDLPRGATLGVIGGTGAGKSSLVALIARFYDPTSGRILYNGKDLRSLSEKELRAQIGMVPQKPELFSGTIRDNLLWGNPHASDEDLWQAVKDAGAEEVVNGKKGGLEEPVEQFGRNFSGGQKQRLTIARALVRRPEILILDDSFSALDYATEAQVRSAIASLPYTHTTIIVSQRTSSLRHADAILVLDNGKMAGYGSHEELLSTCPVYKEIHDSQERREDKV